MLFSDNQAGFEFSRFSSAVWLLIFSVILASFSRNGIGVFNIEYLSFIQYCVLYLLWMHILKQSSKGFTQAQLKKILYRLLLTFVVLNALLSLGSYLRLDGTLFIADNFYNAQTHIDGVLQNATLGDGKTARRIIGMFSSSTQLGAFGALSVLLLNALSDRSRDYIHFVLGSIVVISSESRTALLILALLLVIYLRKKGVLFYVLALLAGVVFYQYMDLFLGERVLDSLTSFDSFRTTGDKQRVYYWLLFFKRLADDPFILVYGLREISTSISSKRNFFESEYLNLISRAGIVGLGFYLMLLRELLRKVNRIGDGRTKFFMSFYVKLFLLLGVTQGMFFSPRFIVLNAIVFLAATKLLHEKNSIPHSS